MSNRSLLPRIKAPAEAGMVGSTNVSSGSSPPLTSSMQSMLARSDESGGGSTRLDPPEPPGPSSRPKESAAKARGSTHPNRNRHGANAHPTTQPGRRETKSRLRPHRGSQTTHPHGFPHLSHAPR